MLFKSAFFWVFSFIKIWQLLPWLNILKVNLIYNVSSSDKSSFLFINLYFLWIHFNLTIFYIQIIKRYSLHYLIIIQSMWYYYICVSLRIWSWPTYLNDIDSQTTTFNELFVRVHEFNFEIRVLYTIFNLSSYSIQTLRVNYFL